MGVGRLRTSIVGRGCKQLPECKWRQINVENGGVVDRKAKQDTNQEELLRRLEAIWVEVAILGVVIVDEKSCFESVKDRRLQLVGGPVLAYRDWGQRPLGQVAGTTPYGVHRHQHPPLQQIQCASLS